MNRHAKVVICCLLVTVFVSPGDADEADRRRRAYKKQQEQIQQLLKRYRDAGEHQQRREQVVDEAVARGKAFAQPLLAVVERQGRQMLQQYGKIFQQRIAVSPRISADAVVNAHDDLKNYRSKMIRMAALAEVLEDCVLFDQRANDPPEEPQPGLKDRFQTMLTKLEQGAVTGWLRDHGYGRLTPLEREVYVAINQMRKNEQLRPVVLDYDLCAAARDHSGDMVRKRFFSHKSKVQGKTSYGDRAARFGTTASGEIIANCPDCATAMRMWKASRGHKRAILTAEYQRIGVGAIGRKITVMFGLPATE